MSTSAETCCWHGLVLDPLDVLFFRDGRPFDAANRVLSGLPTPQTVAGAVRTALLSATGCPANSLPRGTGPIADRLRRAGADEAILTAAFRGPWLAIRQREDADHVDPLFVCPANLRLSREDHRLYRIGRPRDQKALPVSGWNAAGGLWPIDYDGELNAKPDLILLTSRGLRRFLESAGTKDSLTLSEGADYRLADETFKLDHRTGIGIDPSRLSTIHGELYGVGLLALTSETRLYVEVCLPPRLADCLRESARRVLNSRYDRHNGSVIHVSGNTRISARCRGRSSAAGS
jgi:CRISPR-associated protein Cmr3